MPAVDDPEVRKQRLDLYLSFLGPAGHATPDDVEVMNSSRKMRDSPAGSFHGLLARYVARTSATD